MRILKTNNFGSYSINAQRDVYFDQHLELNFSLLYVTK